MANLFSRLFNTFFGLEMALGEVATSARSTSVSSLRSALPTHANDMTAPLRYQLACLEYRILSVHESRLSCSAAGPRRHQLSHICPGHCFPPFYSIQMESVMLKILFFPSECSRL